MSEHTLGNSRTSLTVQLQPSTFNPASNQRHAHRGKSWNSSAVKSQGNPQLRQHHTPPGRNSIPSGILLHPTGPEAHPLLGSDSHWAQWKPWLAPSSVTSPSNSRPCSYQGDGCQHIPGEDAAGAHFRSGLPTKATGHTYVAKENFCTRTHLPDLAGHLLHVSSQSQERWTKWGERGICFK